MDRGPRADSYPLREGVVPFGVFPYRPRPAQLGQPRRADVNAGVQGIGYTGRDPNARSIAAWTREQGYAEGGTREALNDDLRELVRIKQRGKLPGFS